MLISTELAAHRKWVRGEVGGKRADLSGASLGDADLSGADLRGTVLDQRNRPADATDSLREAGIPIHGGIALLLQKVEG